MTAILFATSEEAAPFMDGVVDGRFDGLDEGAYVRLGDTLVTVSGEGKIKATLATERLLRDYDVDLVVHAGGAVALDEELGLGTLIGATFVVEGDRVDLDDPSYPRMPLDPWLDSLAEGTLVTQDHASQGSESQTYWERIGDLRDTTGYAVAYVAAQHGTPCHIVKGITGSETDTDPDNRHAAYTAVAECLQTHLTDELEAAS